jgi:hypothetical protein
MSLKGDEKMPTWAYVLIAVGAAAVVVAAVAAWALTRRRTGRLRSTFASEYDRTVAESGSRREAERELAEREKRREELVIVPLSTAARERFAARWQQTQSDFVDSPQTAVRDANALVEEVMQERGYSVENFDEQAAVVSVDHPDVVENYRTAHAVSVSASDGGASTEDLRRAMRHYRALFEELLGEPLGNGDGAAVREREEVTR